MKKIVTKSIYGNIAIPKAYCKECKESSFIIGGEFVCCGANIENFDKEVKKREIECEPKRRKASAKEKKKVLELQENRCIYCNKQFGEYIFDNKRNKFRKIRIHWDHFVSYSYSKDNRDSNFVAACNICNLIKSDKFFDSIESATDYINEIRLKKGY